MKFTTNQMRISLSAAAFFCAASVSLAGHAQAAQEPGKIHGTITNAIGAPVNSGEIRLTTDRSSEADKRKYEYTFPVDATGNYKGDGVKPGDYLLVYFDQNKSVDYIDHIIIKSNEDLAQNDDMTREEYQKTLTPEQKKEYADIKSKNASALANNAKVANVNALLTKARAEMKANDYDSALTDMQQAAAAKGDEPLVQFELGNAQLGAKKYDDAITTYQKAAELNAASKKPANDLNAAIYGQLGLAYAHTGKADDASKSFDKAAQIDPTKAGQYFYNEAAVLSNMGKSDEANAAADKAIAADPNRAESYYIKGQALIGKSTLDPKSQKIVPPPGCLEAYTKYLELDPNGRHAADVKAIISGFDDKIVNNYRAGHKK